MASPNGSASASAWAVSTFPRPFVLHLTADLVEHFLGKIGREDVRDMGGEGDCGVAGTRRDVDAAPVRLRLDGLDKSGERSALWRAPSSRRSWQRWLRTAAAPAICSWPVSFESSRFAGPSTTSTRSERTLGWQDSRSILRLCVQSGRPGQRGTVVGWALALEAFALAPEAGGLFPP